MYLNKPSCCCFLACFFHSALEKCSTLLIQYSNLLFHNELFMTPFGENLKYKYCYRTIIWVSSSSSFAAPIIGRPSLSSGIYIYIFDGIVGVGSAAVLIISYYCCYWCVQIMHFSFNASHASTEINESESRIGCCPMAVSNKLEHEKPSVPNSPTSKNMSFVSSITSVTFVVLTTVS